MFLALNAMNNLSQTNNPTTKQKKKLILATSVTVSLPTERSVASWSLAAGYDMRDNLASRA